MTDGKDKKIIVFTFADCMGGVSSFNRNIINYSSLRSQFYVRVILLNDEQDKRKKFEDELYADDIIHFGYSYFENLYHVYKRLAKVIGDEKGCLVTDNALTLNAIRQIGTTKSIVFFVHDYYYVNVAAEFKKEIDACISHAAFFKDVLLAMDMQAFQNKVQYIPYGVEQTDETFSKSASPQSLRLVFLGRWEESKGVLQLKEIDDLLKDKKIPVSWTIIGSGSLEKKLKAQWATLHHVHFVTVKSTSEVFALLAEQDVLVFPSAFEGTPVAIMEAISRGVVPVVKDLPGGTRELVSESIGFRCQDGTTGEFANVIEYLHLNRDKLQILQHACLMKAKNFYDIRFAADNYFKFFEKAASAIVHHPDQKKSQLRGLNKSFIPNKLVYYLRKMKQKPETYE